MSRWRSKMPRYRTPIIIQQTFFNASSGIGNNVAGAAHVRVLKALSTSTASSVTLPTDPAPASSDVEPGTYADGWTAWWPDPPDHTGNYQIPDPPTIPRPVMPTRANKVLWEARAMLGSSIWTPRISAVYALCDVMPKTGKEMMQGMQELSTQEAALKIRPSIFRSADIQPLKWSVTFLDDNSVWNLRSVTHSRRRGEFVELMVDRTER